MRRFVLAVVMGVAVSGCATRALPLDQLGRVPEDRVFNTAMTVPEVDTQKITVVRNGGFFTPGGGSNLLVFVDGQKVAELATDEYVNLYLTRGDHLLSAGSKHFRSFAVDVALALVIPTRYSTYRIDSAPELHLQPSLQ